MSFGRFENQFQWVTDKSQELQRFNAATERRRSANEDSAMVDALTRGIDNARAASTALSAYAFSSRDAAETLLVWIKSRT